MSDNTHNYAKQYGGNGTTDEALPRFLWWQLDEWRATEEEAEHVSHYVIADDHWHRHQKPTNVHTSFNHGSYRSSIVKFPDFCQTFQVREWQFPLPYRNNNPIAQMLEMAHYIPRFIITMKHVICGAILSVAIGSGEGCKLPQWGLGWSPSGNRIWCILVWKTDIWWHQFFIYPWPFPDHSNSLTFSSFLWPVGTLFNSEF